MNDPREVPSEIVRVVDAVLLHEDRFPPPDKNPCAIYLLSLMAGSSRDTTRSALHAFLRAGLPPPVWMEDPEERAIWRRAPAQKAAVDILTYRWWDLRRSDFQAARTVLMDEQSTNSANKILISARGVMREAREQNLISESDLGSIARVPRATGSVLLAGRALLQDEVQRVLAACKVDTTPIGKRDAAAFALTWGTGVRRNELTCLDVSSLQAGLLHVDGKRRKKRDVPVSNETLGVVARWLDVRGREPGPLLLANTHAGQIAPGRRMAGQSIYDAFAALGKLAGVEDVSPHNVRRTFITELLDQGVDVLTVAKLAGHDDPKTTKLYDRRSEVAMRKAIDERMMPR